MTASSPRRRLLVFAPGLTEIGGAAQQSRVLIDALVSHGWDVRVICRSATLWRFNRYRQPGLSVLEVPGFGYNRAAAGLYLLIAIPMGFVVALRSTAIISIQLYSQLVAAALVGIIAHRPVLAWTTTSGTLSEIGYLERSRFRGVRLWLLNKVAFVVAQTRVTSEEVSTVLPSEKVVVVPNPVRRVPDAPLDGRPRVLFAGRFVSEKNVAILVDAWRAVLERVPDAHLTLAGASGSHPIEEGEVAAILASDERLHQGVSLLGWVSDMGSLWRDHDVFVLPSLTEGMSNSLIEACAWRRVVVASSIGPNMAVLGSRYPLLVDPKDVPGWTAALVTAMTDDEARGDAVAQIDQRLEAMDATTVAERWTELIDRAVSETARS